MRILTWVKQQAKELTVSSVLIICAVSISSAILLCLSDYYIAVNYNLPSVWFWLAVTVSLVSRALGYFLLSNKGDPFPQKVVAILFSISLPFLILYISQDLIIFKYLYNKKD